MATITSNGTGGGDWSAGASWTGGVAPAGTDSVVIADGDTITKDTSKGAPDCTTITINAGSVLSIPTGLGIKCGGLATSAASALIRIRGTGEFETTGACSAYVGLWDVQGSAGSIAKLTMNNQHLKMNAGGVFRHADIDNPNYSEFYGAVQELVFEDVEFYSCNYFLWGAWGAPMFFRRCWIAGAADMLYSGGAGTFIFENCLFGKRRDNSVVSNSGGDFHFNTNGGVMWITRNCTFSSTILRGTITSKILIESESFNGTPGLWRVDQNGGYAFRSTDAKKTGTYGAELVPVSTAGTRPLYVEFRLPVMAGQSITPTLYVQQAGADLALAGEELEIEFDCGNQWGLNQKLNPTPAYGAGWQLVTFTGGTVGGSGSGELLIRVQLRKYAAGGKVYLADPSWDAGSFGSRAALVAGGGSSPVIRPGGIILGGIQ